jgi:hypothetical protein
MSNKSASLELTAKFIKGLQNYNLTYDEIQSNGWKYCGGRDDRHLKYFKLVFKERPLPIKQNKCVCGHHIEENCYITDGTQILVLGNCCIKKFIPNSSRTCEKCGEPHKNRLVNRCHNCRIGICDNCGKICDETYKKCYNCTFNKKSSSNVKKIKKEEEKTICQERKNIEEEMQIKREQEIKEQLEIEELKRKYYMCPECAEWKVPKEKKRYWTMCKDCYNQEKQKETIKTEKNCLDCKSNMPQTIEHWKVRCLECHKKYSSNK